MRKFNSRKNSLKKIGFGLLVSGFVNIAFADLDLKPTVEEYDKHESGFARIVLGGGGVVSLARTFATGAMTPLAVYGGAAVGYYLVHKARPNWFPL